MYVIVKKSSFAEIAPLTATRLPTIRHLGCKSSLAPCSSAFRAVHSEAARINSEQRESEVEHFMSWKSKLALGVLTALAMMALTYALPRGGAVREAALVQFPVTVGVWAIFVLLFVKLK